MSVERVTRFRIDLSSAASELAMWNELEERGDEPVRWYADALAYLYAQGAVAFPMDARIELGQSLSAAGTSLATIVTLRDQSVQTDGPLEAMFEGKVEADANRLADALRRSLELANGLLAAAGAADISALSRAATVEGTRLGDRVHVLWTCDPESLIEPGSTGTAAAVTGRGVEVDWDDGVAHPLVNGRDFWEARSP
jgi:hypothetical protein